MGRGNCRRLRGVRRGDSGIAGVGSGCAAGIGGPGCCGEELGGIPYSSSITVNLMYDEAMLGTPAGGIGFLVPASEGRTMLALHVCAPQVSGANGRQARCFARVPWRMRMQALLTEKDGISALLAAVRRGVERDSGITARAGACAGLHAGGGRCALRGDTRSDEGESRNA